MAKHEPVEPQYDTSDEAIARFDKIKEDAITSIQGADGFIVLLGYAEGEGFNMKAVAGVRNIPAPALLREARKKITALERQAREGWDDAVA